MKSTLDRFGRVVIPKAIREDLALESGAELQIESSDEGILLKPVREKPHLRLKQGVLVFSGSAREDLRAAVEAQREERIRSLASWSRE